MVARLARSTALRRLSHASPSKPRAKNSRALMGNGSVQSGMKTILQPVARLMVSVNNGPDGAHAQSHATGENSLAHDTAHRPHLAGARVGKCSARSHKRRRNKIATRTHARKTAITLGSPGSHAVCRAVQERWSAICRSPKLRTTAVTVLEHITMQTNKFVTRTHAQTTATWETGDHGSHVSCLAPPLHLAANHK